MTLLPRLPWYAVGALLYLCCGYTEMMGSDLWWHLAAGREIVQSGSPWLSDRWSFTATGNTWTNHEWLADVLFFAWARLFGVATLVWWKWLVIAVSFLLLQGVLERETRQPAAALLAAASAALIAAPFLDLRPQLYALLGIAALLAIAFRRRPRLRELLPLFVFWANLHGSVLFGLMLLAILVFPWRCPDADALRRAFFTCLVCTAACLLNPHGPFLIWLPLEYALDSASPWRGLAEWRSPLEPGGIEAPLFAYSLVVAATAVMSLVLPRVRRALSIPAETLALLALTGAMAITSRRFIVLWAVAFALLSAPCLAWLLRREALRWLRGVALLAVLLPALLRLQGYPLRPAVAFHYLVAEYSFPAGIVDYLEQRGIKGDALTYYNWGGYLHWRLDGAVRVFIDGRANTVFDDATYTAYLRVLGTAADAPEIALASGARLLIWPRARGGERVIRRFLATGSWRLLHEDLRGVVLAHESFAGEGEGAAGTDAGASPLRAAMRALRAGDYAAAIELSAGVREHTPWDWNACTYQRLALRGSGDEAAGRAVIEACRRWFPSRYLR